MPWDRRPARRHRRGGACASSGEPADENVAARIGGKAAGGVVAFHDRGGGDRQIEVAAGGRLDGGKHVVNAGEARLAVDVHLADRGGETQAEVAGVDRMAEAVEVLARQQLDHIVVLELGGDEELTTDGGLLDQRAGRQQAGEREEPHRLLRVGAHGERGLGQRDLRAHAGRQVDRIEAAERGPGLRLVAVGIGEYARDQPDVDRRLRIHRRQALEDGRCAAAQHVRDGRLGVAAILPYSDRGGGKLTVDLGEKRALRDDSSGHALRDPILDGLQRAYEFERGRRSAESPDPAVASAHPRSAAGI